MADLDSVRTVLAQAIASHDYATPAVRESVIAYARHERKRAVPPERLVIAVKTLAHDSHASGLSDWWRSILIDRFVRWAIEGYYGIEDSEER